MLSDNDIHPKTISLWTASHSITGWPLLVTMICLEPSAAGLAPGAGASRAVSTLGVNTPFSHVGAERIFPGFCLPMSQPQKLTGPTEAKPLCALLLFCMVKGGCVSREILIGIISPHAC